MSGYPPGTTRRDLVRGGIIEPHNHDHEWRPVEESPIIEDGAAIFREECAYAEGEYGQGWQCEKSRSYRFEYDTLELIDGGEIKLAPIENWDQNDEALKEVITTIEQKFLSGDSEVEISIDPDPKHGIVSLDYLGYSLCYRP